MFTENIKLKNFNLKKNSHKIRNDFHLLLKDNNRVLNSLSKNYKNSFKKKHLSKFKKYKKIRIIGMGGSILGTESIYNFLKHKIKKNFYFSNNIQTTIKSKKIKEPFLNVVVSKSGNTLETISNTNILIKHKDTNIFITENRKSYLYLLAEKLKAEIIHHNNFIGGRYSVLSEVGMLPAELMGLNIVKFKQLNTLIKNKNFINELIISVNNTLYFLKQKRFNSIILNYDERSNDIFKWYQQLLAESLGKKGMGMLPVISPAPQDHHSLLQLYLDGPKNKIFYILSSKSLYNLKIKKNYFKKNHNFLSNLNLEKIVESQRKAFVEVLKEKKIPFREFHVSSFSENILGELFSYFMLETALIGSAMKINPFNQDAVEEVKIITKKNLT